MLHIDTGDLLTGLARAGDAVRGCIADWGSDCARQAEDYAKRNRPWTDRTGNARRTLEGVFVPGGLSDGDGGIKRGTSGSAATHTYSLGVVGHMPYSVFLELGYGQNYAILHPTILSLSPEFLRVLADRLDACH